MAELTLESISQLLDTKLKGFVTQEILDDKLRLQTEELKQFSRQQTEELAAIIANTIATPMQTHFDELPEELSAGDRLIRLERSVQEIRTALHLSPM